VIDYSGGNIMKVVICENKEDLGKRSAALAAEVINKSVAEKGSARLLLSTGISQFPFFKEFVKENIEWSKVEMFHLDEYVGIDDSHKASFKRYLLDYFVNVVNPGKCHLIDGTKEPKESIAALTVLLNKKPVDLGLIGIGENAHIAFNDPPAVFDDTCAYKVVELEDRCLDQQVGEGWFKSKEECFRSAITMTCPQIMKCLHIISVVPYKVKAEAIYNTLTGGLSPMVPATLLKEHGDCTLYCDRDSSSLLTQEIIDRFA
jgi:glucosamine-6-phosphate deaminase